MHQRKATYCQRKDMEVLQPKPERFFSIQINKGLKSCHLLQYASEIPIM